MSGATADVDLTADEREGYRLVQQTGGIHQSDFWKELGVSSRKGSRIVESLVEKGLVDRDEAVYKGYNTYFITPVIEEKDLDFSLLMAGDMLSPFVGEEEIDPRSDAFSQWIMNLAYERR